MAKANLIQKINKMDRKQAYTIGAILVVVFIALLTLASFFGKTDDSSFSGFDSHGYDLASMPFVNDEAEAYLLASKYPDMQNNGASLLYSEEEKEARQEEDEEDDDNDSEGSGSGYDSDEDLFASDGGYGGRGYGGRGGGGGGGTTAVGSLGKANVSGAHGSGISSTFGAPRGDFSPYKSQDKGKEIAPQVGNTDPRKALSQWAQASNMTAKVKDGRGANAKRSSWGSDLKVGGPDGGVDLSKASGIQLDTNAPEASPDLSDLNDKLNDKAKDAQQENEQSLWDKLLETFLTGLVNMGVNAIGNVVNNGIDNLMSKGSQNSASKAYTNGQLDQYKNKYAGKLNKNDWDSFPEEIKSYLGGNANNAKWNSDGTLANSNFSHSQSHRSALVNSGAPELNVGGTSTGNSVNQGRQDARTNAKNNSTSSNNNNSSSSDVCVGKEYGAKVWTGTTWKTCK